MGSHKTIYQFVWAYKKYGNKQFTHLRRRRHHNKKRDSLTNGCGFIQNRVDIDKQSAIIDKKVRFDDLEIDTIIEKNHKAVLLTINDRETEGLNGKEANPQTEVTIDALKHFIDQKHTQRLIMEKNSVFTKRLQVNRKFLFTLQNHTIHGKEMPTKN